jgi:hypothetical protein
LLAVESFGQHPCHGRLANAAGTGKEIGMGDATETNGVFERARDVLLLNDIVKRAWAPLAGRYLIRHNRSLSAICTWEKG